MKAASWSLATLAAVLALAGTAQAQGTDEFGAYGGLQDKKRYESPQNVAVEIRFGPYVPNVDDELGGGATPFRDTFGDDNRYLLGVEVDWQALRIPKVGSFGPGVGIGYTKMTGRGLLADGTQSAQDTSLTILPMYAVGVLRVDVLAQETVVPLAAYGKLGLGWGFWWVSDGEGLAHDDSGDSGNGFSYGYQFALGAMLLLDALDQDAAVQMDASTGINNSYLFFEWYYSDLDGFGSGEQMQIGDNTWFIGLAFEI